MVAVVHSTSGGRPSTSIALPAGGLRKYDCLIVGILAVYYLTEPESTSSYLEALEPGERA
jgi:hypothetical protein